MTEGDLRYIWVVRWRDFQHYAPERDRAPAWIKTYTKQLDDEAYLGLTARQRALLHDLRMVFAKASGKLSVTVPQRSRSVPVTVPQRSRNLTALSRRLGLQVFRADLEALNQAGFIEFISRTSLDQRLEEVYTSRAPARSKEEEVEEELEKNPSFLPTEAKGPGRTEGDEKQPPDETPSNLQRRLAEELRQRSEAFL